LQAGKQDRRFDLGAGRFGRETDAGEVGALNHHRWAIAGLGRRRGIHLVEDWAQANGASRNGRMAATFGDVATFSFGGRKLLSAGRGGANRWGGRAPTSSQLSTPSPKWVCLIRPA